MRLYKLPFPNKASLNALSNIGISSAGQYTTYVVKNNGDLYVSGWNNSGQIGNNTTTPNHTYAGPVMTNIRQVVSGTTSNGTYYAVALKMDGTVWVTGSNYDASLGTGGNINKLVWTQLPIIDTVVQIATGMGSTFALKADGTLWACGNQTNGLLGNGQASGNINTLTQVASGVAYVAAGENVSFIIKTDGSLWATGKNAQGQFGLGNNTTFFYTWTDTGLRNVAQVSAGANSNIAVKTDGTVWGAGYSANGELGNGSTASKNVWTQVSGITNAKKVACGLQNSTLLLADGRMLVTGPKATCGMGSSGNLTSFTQVLSNIVDIGCYRQMVFGLSNSGIVYSTGDNALYGLGDGTQTQQYTFGTEISI